MATQVQISNMIQSRTNWNTRQREILARLNLPGKSQRAETRRANLEKMLNHMPIIGWRSNPGIEYRQKLTNKALGLARMADINFDEHGSGRGSYRTTGALDYVPPKKAAQKPYCDMGGGGLGLISITRTTVYAKSSKWRSSSTTEHYLVGRNEAGTFFSHRVPAEIMTVSDAIAWIWDGKHNAIISRQGDIALISGNGPKGLDKLPHGHKVSDGYIIHDTHPPIRLPGKNERIIVARRAGIRGNGAATETRD